MLEGKCALITGSGQGIGLEIATEFAKAGAKVMLYDINEETLKESVESLTSQGFTHSLEFTRMMIPGYRGDKTYLLQEL
ncbi:SDR family NAD(P)-dependent oxidoreductase [Pseudalkalibacillus hwajinpoensis]|uniref:SDR family NAD(P)-dependent oxidoreductase n=1 Tax=Guptibacillus hwajinpoensis TaxID=208199 RepID=UPI00325AE3A3